MLVLLLLLFLTLSVGLSAAALWWVADRGRRGRREIDRRLHDRALDLDRRFDAAERRLARVEVGQKISHLHHLVAIATAGGRLSAPASERLHRFLLDLEEESHREGRD